MLAMRACAMSWPSPCHVFGTTYRHTDHDCRIAQLKGQQPLFRPGGRLHVEIEACGLSGVPRPSDISDRAEQLNRH